MPSVYTPNKLNNPTGYTMPVDGDTPIKVSDIRPALEGLADGVAFATERLRRLSIAQLILIAAPTNGMIRYAGPNGEGRVYEFLTSGYSPRAPWVYAASDATPGSWCAIGYRERLDVISVDARDLDSIGNVETWTSTPTGHLPIAAEVSIDANRGVKFADVWTSNGSRRHMVFDLTKHVPLGGEIVRVDVWVRGATGHAALPSVQPSIRVLRQSITNDGDRVSLSSVNAFVDDAAANVTAYQTTHAFGLSCDQNNVIAQGYVHQLVLGNEAGTNGLLGLTVLGFDIQYRVYGETQ
jgi:hypothetical protein